MSNKVTNPADCIHAKFCHTVPDGLPVTSFAGCRRVEMAGPVAVQLEKKAEEASSGKGGQVNNYTKAYVAKEFGGDTYLTFRERENTVGAKISQICEGCPVGEAADQ